MDPIKVRERLSAAWIEMREAETDVLDMAHEVNGGAAGAWTKEQREAAYGLIVQAMGLLARYSGNRGAREVYADAIDHLRGLAGVPR